MATKVTGVRQVKSGNTQANEIPEGQSALGLCQDRWEHLRDEVKGKSWAQCPPEMVCDFVRSTAHYFEQLYGEEAVFKSFQHTASGVFSDPSRTEITLVAAYSGSPASFSVRISPTTETQEDRNGEIGSVEFDVTSDAEGEDDVREGLRAWAEDEQPITRFVFDPLTQLPVRDMMALVKHVENNVSTDDLTVLSACAFTLLWWKQHEDMNAEIGELSVSGLSVGDTELRPGEKIVASSFSTALDSGLEENLEEGQQFVVSKSTKKMLI